MAIRFSCCASQFTVFMNRSRLPSTPRYALAAKSESPIAATRVSGFGASSAGFCVLAAGPAPAWPRAPPSRRRSTPGPACRPCPGRRTRQPSGRSATPASSPPSCAPPSAGTSGRTASAVTVSACRFRTERKHRDEAEIVRDRVRRIGRRRHRHGRDSREAADVDDDGLGGLDAPLLEQAGEPGHRRRLLEVLGRVEQHQQLAAARCQISR